jgi:hypothetical protein
MHGVSLRSNGGIGYWNGCSMMDVHTAHQAPDVTIFTDASGSWGCGGAWGNGWLQAQWSETWVAASIAVKELLPIALAVAIWGCEWQHKHVYCDNMAVVQIVNKTAETHSCYTY